MLSKGCVRRRRRSQSEIERSVQEFGASGLTQKEFAQQVGVHPLSVARWIRTTAVGSCSHGVLRDETTPASAPQFVEVRVRPTRAPMQTVPPVDWPPQLCWQEELALHRTPGFRMAQCVDLLPTHRRPLVSAEPSRLPHRRAASDPHLPERDADRAVALELEASGSLKSKVHRNRPAEPCEARGGKFEMGGGLATDCRCALQAGGTGAPAALARASRQPRGVSAQMSFWG